MTESNDTKGINEGGSNVIKDTIKDAYNTSKVNSVLKIIDKMKNKGKESNLKKIIKSKLSIFQWFLNLNFMTVFTIFCILILFLIFIYYHINNNYQNQYHTFLFKSDQYYDYILSKLRSLFSQNGLFIITKMGFLINNYLTKCVSIFYYLLLHLSRELNNISDQFNLLMSNTA